MTLRFPLWLKVSAWLVLNLLLLSTVSGMIFFAQLRSGKSFLTGRAAERVQAISNVVRGEIEKNRSRDLTELLDNFSENYGVEFVVFGINGEQIGGQPVVLPKEVQDRIKELPAGPPQFQRGGGRRGGGSRGGPAPTGAPGGPAPAAQPPQPAPRGDVMREAQAVVDDAAQAAKSAQETAARAEAIVRAFRGPPPSGSEGSRFMMPAGAPTRFYIGTRFGLPVPNDFRDRPSVFIAISDSLEAAGLILDFRPLLITGVGVAAISILFWLPVVKGVTGTLRRLTRATETIAEGKFDTRVEITRSDELGRLGDSVNRMAGRLDTLVNGQRRFLGDIAHELGSPIARMQFATGILEDRADPSLKGAVADVKEEVQNMSELVNELLAFTRAGLKPREVAIADVELAPLVSRTLEREDAGARAVANVAAGLKVRCDEALLSRAVNNLVRNALRYAGDGGPITIEAQKTGDNTVRLTIADQGPGVPPEALARLGEPFYRPETARTRETGGVGLGLAIVRSAVQACEGTIHFSNRTPRGFAAEITLKAA